MYSGTRFSIEVQLAQRRAHADHHQGPPEPPLRPAPHLVALGQIAALPGDVVQDGGVGRGPVRRAVQDQPHLPHRRVGVGDGHHHRLRIGRGVVGVPVRRPAAAAPRPIPGKNQRAHVLKPQRPAAQRRALRQPAHQPADQVRQAAEIGGGGVQNLVQRAADRRTYHRQAHRTASVKRPCRIFRKRRALKTNACIA